MGRARVKISKGADPFFVEAGVAADGAFRDDVAAGLGRSPKSLPSRYLYDAHGSRLFERICETPEYYLTHAERQILEAHADDIISRVAPPVDLIELGSGSAVKTRRLIAALLARHGALRYFPVDISRSAVEASARSLMGAFPRLEITGIIGEYQPGLRMLAGRRRGPKLVLWLGSSIGNLDRAAATGFLGLLAQDFTAADRLLFGIDLRKPRDVLERAYDDAAGVTAAFNLNLLARINRELGGGFDLAAFSHRALWDEHRGSVDMYLVSRCDQEVRIEQLHRSFVFQAGETIHTESSYKYSGGEIQSMVRAAGLTIVGQWSDPQERFASVLLSRR